MFALTLAVFSAFVIAYCLERAKQMRYEVYEWYEFAFRLLTKTDSYIEALTWVTFTDDQIFDTYMNTWVK